MPKDLFQDKLWRQIQAMKVGETIGVPIMHDCTIVKIEKFWPMKPPMWKSFDTIIIDDNKEKNTKEERLRYWQPFPWKMMNWRNESLPH